MVSKKASSYILSTYFLLTVALLVRVFYMIARNHITVFHNNYFQYSNGDLLLPPLNGFFPIGNQLFTEAVYYLAGTNLVIFNLIFCLLGAIIPLVIVQISLYLGIGILPSWMSGWISCFLPILIILSDTWKHMLFPVLLLLLLTLIILIPSNHFLKNVIFIFVTYCLILTRSDYSLITLSVFVVDRIHVTKPRISWMTRLSHLLGAIILATVTNSIVTGNISPSSSNTFYNLFTGNNPLTAVGQLHYGTKHYEPEITMWTYLESIGIQPKDGLDRYTSEATTISKAKFFLFVKEDPLQFVWGLLLKSMRFWDFRLDGAEVNSIIENIMYSLPKYFYSILAFVGLGMAFSERRKFLFLYMTVWFGLFMAPQVIFFSLARLRVPLDVMQIILTSYSASVIFLWVRGHDSNHIRHYSIL